ncbi:MAG: hypothetical protein M1546_23435 [Chloroflexi bacterium]|nr:hypothetical protein [Chloroflexota bacterium]
MSIAQPSYSDLVIQVTHPRDGDAIFVCGRRCAAEIDLSRLRIGRAATSPVDILTEMTLDIPGVRTQSVLVYPNHVEKVHALAEHVTAHSVWFAAWDSPCLAVWWTIQNRSGVDYTFCVDATARYNVNYISKFRLYPNDVARIENGYVVVTDTKYPRLHAITGMAPSWDTCALSSDLPDAPLGDRLDDPAQVRATFHGQILVPAGETRMLTIAAGGSNQPSLAEKAVQVVLADPGRVYAQMLQQWQQAVADGVVIDTPDAGLNHFFLQSKLWGYKDTRLVPVGEPFDLDRNDNADLPALTASPDYHGIFANDNGQSCWEYGCLGPAFYPILANTLETLYRFGVPESVEVDPVDATGRPWLSPLCIGQRPEWVMGACYLMLWSGQYTGSLWPRVQQVLAGFKQDDADGDWLDDYSSSTFPEQPDPHPYSHEMLYASAFWYRAFVEAAKVAGMLDDAARATEYAGCAQQIAQAVEAKFASDFGYASWLDASHRQHPHRGHNMVLPLQYEMASPARARTTFQTLLASPIGCDDGPLAIEPGYPLAGAAHAWTFMRWNLVHALYRYGETRQATVLLLKWLAQEAALYYQAPEGFPTITGVTGKGYSWSAGRAMRAILFGLFGLELHPHGFSFSPRLPADWPRMSLSGLVFRGATYDIVIERKEPAGVFLDGSDVKEEVICCAGGGHHMIRINV